jgi:pimeloyl-ACP methyl ester carboxylesterase
MATICTPFRTISTVEIGRGPPLLVIHGGPGFRYDYMLEPLAPLADTRTLVYFPQLGCEEQADQTTHSCVTAMDNVSDVEAVAQALSARGRFDIIAHSWGTYIAPHLLGLDVGAAIHNLILVSSVPCRWDLLQLAFTRARFRREALVRGRVQLALHQSQNSSVYLSRRRWRPVVRRCSTQLRPYSLALMRVFFGPYVVTI